MPKVLAVLPDDVLALIAAGRGMFDAATAQARGIRHGRLRRLVEAGLLARVGHGRYVSGADFRELDDWQRHRIEARAFSAACPDAYLTGWSAAVCWRLPTVGQPPVRPVALRPKSVGLGRTLSSRGRILVADLPEHHRWLIGTTRVVSRAWSAVNVARHSAVPDALIVADAAARAGADLGEALDAMHRWPGTSRATWVVEHADPNAETALETLGRFTSLAYGLPMPVCNAWVGAEGPRYRVDGLWPFHWAASEGDGALKYNNRPDASRIVAAQNEREWCLRRLGLDVIRYDWDLAARRRPELAGRFAALLRDNPVRSQPIRWWKDVPGIGPVTPSPEDWPSARPVTTVLPVNWHISVGTTPPAGPRR